MATAANGNYVSPVDLQLPKDPPDNIRGAETRALYEQFQQSAQVLAETLYRYTGALQQDSALWSSLTPDDTILFQNMNRFYCQTSEAISFGAIVNLHLSGGVIKARNANATTTARPGYGWCNTSGGILSGGYGEFILKGGLCTGISGLTIGSRYWLSTSNGLITATEPAVSGNIQQYVGLALDTDRLYVDIQPTYVVVP